MQTQQHDIVNILQKEQQWHMSQLRRIHFALEAAKRQINAAIPPKKIAWKAEIDALFDVYDELRPQEIAEALVQKGFADAALLDRRMNIYATLAQMVRDEILEKVERGVYRKIL